MGASRKLRRNLAAEKLVDVLQQVAKPEREKILVRLQKLIDSARKKVLGGPPKVRRKGTSHKKPGKKKSKA